jgi:hypothetical protein
MQGTEDFLRAQRDIDETFRPDVGFERIKQRYFPTAAEKAI